MEKIPKDLSRWLKDEGYFIEFTRLITKCGYKISDLTYRNDNNEYGIKRWLSWPISEKWVSFYDKCGNRIKDIRYSDFLNGLNLNWNKK